MHTKVYILSTAPSIQNISLGCDVRDSNLSVLELRLCADADLSIEQNRQDVLTRRQRLFSVYLLSVLLLRIDWTSSENLARRRMVQLTAIGVKKGASASKRAGDLRSKIDVSDRPKYGAIESKISMGISRGLDAQGLIAPGSPTSTAWQY
jgi:hypothetical protein